MSRDFAALWEFVQTAVPRRVNGLLRRSVLFVAPPRLLVPAADALKVLLGGRTPRPLATRVAGWDA
jgi:hypothetical protein